MKDKTPPSKFEIQEKHEPRFLQGLGTLEKEMVSKKRLEGGKRKGKRQIQEYKSKIQDKENVPIQSQKEVELNLAVTSFQKVPMTSTQTIPTEVND
jgi:hypothetical protein